MQAQSRDTRPTPILMLVVIALTLATASIHLSLGGMLFTLNAVGYAGLAAALAIVTTVRHPFVQRFAWAPRVGLVGYALATIVGYLVIGPYFTLGWIAKAIEIAIVILLLADLRRAYGSPGALVAAALGSLGLDRGDSPPVASP
jgi:hypothetical protein